MIKPIRNNVVIEKLETSNVTNSGIVIAGSLHEADRAMVISIGPEVIDVKVGDVLLVNWKESKVATFGGEEIFVISEEHIIAVLDA
jgi:co-chaperonin GroES (HSP10)